MSDTFSSCFSFGVFLLSLKVGETGREVIGVIYRNVWDKKETRCTL